MSQVIVIDSSEEEGGTPHPKETMPEETLQNVTKVSETATVIGLFSELYELCEDHVKDNDNGKKILKFLCKKHGEASEEFKSSRPYRKLLQRCISKLKNGSKDVYVHVHNIISVLDRASEVKSLNHSSNEDAKAVPVKKRRISLQCTTASYSSKEPLSVDEGKTVGSGSKETLSENEGKTVGFGSKEPLSDNEGKTAGSGLKEPLSGNEGKNTTKAMKNSEDNCKTSSGKATSDDERQHRTNRRIKKLELLLKRISKEIGKLQSVELSLDDMDQEDSIYVQESKLKRRFMQVYNELCRLNKSSLSTGRVIEKKITVSASRFVEVNRKVQCFINNPKRNSSCPDFADIYHLVKQANYKSQLQLSDSQIKGAAVNIFEEVGDKMQKRRHQDFVFEFGSSNVDDQKDDKDPALSDNSLQKKLSENRLEARRNLDAVIDKYTKLQQVMKEDDPTNSALQEDNEDDPENEESSSDVDSEILKSDGESSTSCTVQKDLISVDLADDEVVEQDGKTSVLQSLKLEAKP